MPPWEWTVPDGMAGKDVRLEVDVTTSIRPVFGSESASGVRLRQKPWDKTQLNSSRSGLCSAKWLTERTGDACAKRSSAELAEWCAK